ncbi:DUF4105 domain-containing protein [Verrucomicrobiota bacterium]
MSTPTGSRDMVRGASGIRRALHGSAHFGGAVLLLLSLLGFHHLIDWPAPVSVLVLAAAAVAWWRFRRGLWMPAAALIMLLAAFTWLSQLEPSNRRDWPAETSVLPGIEVEGSRVTIRGFRNFRWREDGGYEPRWDTRVLDLNDLRELALVVVPFNTSELMAHTMLSFGFGSSNRVVVSVEARKERQEKYGLIPGALRQFELVYILGDERDLLTVRALVRGARLYVYPVRAEPDFIHNLFLDMASAANGLRHRPRFYRSLRDNCTTTLVKHVNRRIDRPIGLRVEALFPALMGRLLHELGYMRTDLPYDQARSRFRADDRVRRHATDPDFSRLIRLDQPTRGHGH